MKLQEDKTRFINNLPWESEEEKSKVLDFFKTHASLESKIQNWQSRDKEGLVNEIRNLISETEASRLEKEKAKQAYRGNIDWEAHDCRYLGEDENWIYITPLSYEGAVFCDSAECGGAGAKWCIGYEKTDAYWKHHTGKGALFLMKFNKHPEDKQNDLKFMIEGYLRKDKVNIWNQADLDEAYELSEKEKEYLVQINKIQVKRINQYFDNPEPGVYVAKNVEAFEHIEVIEDSLKVFKVKEGLDCSSLTDASNMFDGCKSLQSVDTAAFTNITNASCMFNDCRSLQSVDTAAFTNITNADGMFSGCWSLQSIDTSVFKNVTEAGGMFLGCKDLQSIDTSAFRNVTEAGTMFGFCKGLRSIDTSVFTNVTNAIQMFYHCESLQSMDASAFKNVTNAIQMFYHCESLQSIDASAFKNVEDAEDMFKGCISLKTYIPGPNNPVNKELEKIGARPVKRLGESFRRRVIEEILEE